MTPSASKETENRGTVAVVLKGYPRLSETFIAQELRGLERAGLKLRLYSMRHPTDKKRHPVHDEIEAPVVYLPEYLYHAPLRVLRGLLAARRLPGFGAALTAFWRDLKRDVTPNRVRRFGQACVLARELPSDVAHLYAHFIHTPASVTRYAAMMTGLTWTCSAHAKDIWTSPDWELTEKLKHTDWTATCTRIGAEHLRDLAAGERPVHLLYHGLDLTRFPRQETVRAKPPGEPLHVLAVGRAVPKKGFDTLIAALARVPDDIDWQFTHIGGGGELKALRAAADAAGIGNRIDWRGAQSQTEVLAAYRASDVFALPCRIAADGDRDGLPNVLVEAQSQGVACISTPISGIPELIIDGETGLLVPPDDPDALAQAIARLARDDDLRVRLAQAGAERVHTAFDMTTGITELASLFPAHVRSHAKRTSKTISPDDASEAAA
jgi:glycosyltransferase involved in cell wall biosynthesis